MFFIMFKLKKNNLPWLSHLNFIKIFNTGKASISTPAKESRLIEAAAKWKSGHAVGKGVFLLLSHD